MASIRELYRSGYTFAGIEHRNPEQGGDSKLLLRKVPSLEFWNKTTLGANPSVIAGDLHEYIGDRTYGIFLGSEDFLMKSDGSEIHTLKGDRRDGTPETTWATVTSTNNGRNIEITLPAKSDSLYPDVGVSPRTQRQQLLDDYSKIFRNTERALRSGRYD